MVLGNGTLKCWGANDLYQLGLLGNGTRGDSPGEMGMALPPVQLPPNLSVRSVAPGHRQTCALMSDSSVYCWGTNANGVLGRSTGTPSDIVGDQPNEMGSALTRVPLERPVRSLAAGYYSYCALLDNGDVECWGDNTVGQLGAGVSGHRGANAADFPVPHVALGGKAVAVSGGYESFCAILDSGAVKCWGLNDRGQLGNGDTANRGLPGATTYPAVSLGTGRSAVSITVGGWHACARLDDGTAKCWGDNSMAQLGTGNGTPGYNSTALPVSQYVSQAMGDNLPTVKLGTGLTVRSIVAGGWASCAILSNGKVKCWGNNPNGMLGLESNAVQWGDTAATSGDNLPYVNLGYFASRSLGERRVQPRLCVAR